MSNEIEMKILIGLHRNVNAIDRKTAVLSQEEGLTFSQFAVLEALYSKGDMSVGKVRDSILSSQGTISVIIQNLAKSGFIQRLPDVRDRRICILRLTPEGREVIERSIAKNRKMIKEYISVLDDSEKEQLLFLLKKIGGRIRETNRSENGPRKRSD